MKVFVDHWINVRTHPIARSLSECAAFSEARRNDKGGSENVRESPMAFRLLNDGTCKLGVLRPFPMVDVPTAPNVGDKEGVYLRDCFWDKIGGW